MMRGGRNHTLSSPVIRSRGLNFNTFSQRTKTDLISKCPRQEMQFASPQRILGSGVTFFYCLYKILFLLLSYTKKEKNYTPVPCNARACESKGFIT
jgi:hypothetical protein